MDQPVQEWEHRKSQLEKEQQALTDFLNSEGYKAAQRLNQTQIDENIQTMLDLKISNIQEAVPLIDILADIRVRMEFKQQFIERLREIEQELKSKTK